MKHKKTSKERKGTTLIGVLVGIVILSVALAAQVRLIGNTVKREVDMKNLIIATNLSKEGVEIAYAWRMAYGWEKLRQNQNRNFCADVKNVASKPDIADYASPDCDSKVLNIVGYPDYPAFKRFLYDSIGAENANFSIPSFWRTIKIEGCEDQPDEACLNLVAETGWETGKSVKLEKKIYNWYIP